MQIDQVLLEYAAQLPLTIRQIFYRLVATFAYEKTERAYKNLAELLNKARRAGRISFDAIRDDGFTAAEPSFYDDADDFFLAVRHAASRLRLDRQIGQRRRLAVWCEASGMVPQLQRIADPFGIPVYSSGGFDSLTDKYRLGVNWEDRGDAVTMLHIGDQDPSGVHMARSLAEDLIAFAGDEVDIEVVRLAILPDQAALLPSAPPKATDNRSFAEMLIRARTGEDHVMLPIDPMQTWQAEALDPATLAAILQGAIDARFDRDIYARQLAREEQIRQDVISRLP